MVKKKERYKYKDGSHDERFLVECSVKQKEMIYEAANKITCDSGLRAWVLPLLIGAAEEVLDISFDDFTKVKKK